MSATDHPPITEERIRNDLHQLGVRPGVTLVVHSSLSAIGWVHGGAPTVVRALLAAVGEEGTLAMPAATPLCADPATWSHPRLAGEHLEQARAELSAFDRDTTPTTMGAIAETFRTWPETLRSDHPLESVCARGPAAERIVRDHPLAFSEGEGTPFGRLHELTADILLLGVGFDRCTALHFAESLVPVRRVMTVRFPRGDGAERTWHEVPNVADDNGTHFPVVGERFAAAGHVRRSPIGAARSMLFAMPRLVRFAVAYFERELREARP